MSEQNDQSTQRNPYEAPPEPTGAASPMGGGAPIGGSGGISYVPGGGLATTTVVFLGINAAVHAMGVIAGLWFYAELDSLGTLVTSSRQALGVIAIYGLVGIVEILALIGGAITFSMWFYRAYCNLVPLGHEYLYHKPGWAPGSFYVPILNLFRPFQITKEIWLNSDNDDEATRSAIVSVWWAFWLVRNFAGTLSWRLSKGSFAASVLMSTLSDLAGVAAAIMAILMLRRIEARQVRCAKRVLGVG